MGPFSIKNKPSKKELLTKYCNVEEMSYNDFMAMTYNVIDYLDFDFGVVFGKNIDDYTPEEVSDINNQYKEFVNFVIKMYMSEIVSGIRKGKYNLRIESINKEAIKKYFYNIFYTKDLYEITDYISDENFYFKFNFGSTIIPLDDILFGEIIRAYIIKNTKKYEAFIEEYNRSFVDEFKNIFADVKDSLGEGRNNIKKIIPSLDKHRNGTINNEFNQEVFGSAYIGDIYENNFKATASENSIYESLSEKEKNDLDLTVKVLEELGDLSQLDMNTIKLARFVKFCNDKGYPKSLNSVIDKILDSAIENNLEEKQEEQKGLK